MRTLRFAFAACLAVAGPGSAGDGDRPPAPLPFPLVERFEGFGTADGLPSDKIHCVLAADGKVWAGTTKGLAVREEGRFRTIGPGDGLSHGVVTALALDPGTGDLWIGTMRGLNRLSGGRIDTFTQTSSGLPNDVVYGVAVDREAVWVATAAGTGRRDLRTGAWGLYDHTNTIMHEPWCYAVARSPARLFIGVWGGGIVEHDPARGTWKEHRDPDEEMEIDLLPDDGPVHDVTSFIAWDDGVLWQSTYFGLSRYDGTRWRTFLKEKTPLVSNFISFVAAKGRTAWLGTDSGLVVTDGEHWATYRRGGGDGGTVEIARPAEAGKEVRETATALPDEFVLGVAVGEGEVWVATSRGLARGVLGAPGGTGARK